MVGQAKDAALVDHVLHLLGFCQRGLVHDLRSKLPSKLRPELLVGGDKSEIATRGAFLAAVMGELSLKSTQHHVPNNECGFASRGFCLYIVALGGSGKNDKDTKPHRELVRHRINPPCPHSP